MVKRLELKRRKLEDTETRSTILSPQWGSCFYHILSTHLPSSVCNKKGAGVPSMRPPSSRQIQLSTGNNRPLGSLLLQHTLSPTHTMSLICPGCRLLNSNITPIRWHVRPRLDSAVIVPTETNTQSNHDPGAVHLLRVMWHAGKEGWHGMRVFRKGSPWKN